MLSRSGGWTLFNHCSTVISTSTPSKRTYILLLREAFFHKWVDGVMLLLSLKAGADVNKSDALREVIPLKWKEGVEILLEAGADSKTAAHFK